MSVATADGAWLDAMYKNRARVPQALQYLGRWRAASRLVRASHACALDVAYGRGPDERLDVFPASGARAPVLVFLHGGYWRALDKRDHAFIAPPFTRQGVCVVVPNYTLCPAATIPQIAMQMVKAIAWTWRNVARHGGDPRRIVLAGHSAGGQLAALLLTCAWPAFRRELPADLVRKAVSISGLHDLEPLRHTPFLRRSLRLTDERVAQASPARLPAPRHGRLFAVAGQRESAEFHRQCRLVRERWGAQAVPVCELLPGLNHFDVLDAMVLPGHRLHGLVLRALGCAVRRSAS
jgi:arylformamidase